MKHITRWLLSATVAFAGTGMLLAQSSNNVDEVVKIERHAARDYREGEMIVKFKPSSAVRVRSLARGVASGVNAVDQVLGELGVTASEPLMPFTGAEVTPRAKALRSVSGKTIEDSDMSLLYRLTFDAAKVNVHEAIEKVAALDEVEFAEPNYVVYALAEETSTLTNHHDHDDYCKEPLYSQQWGHGKLKLPFLWQQDKLTSKRPVIAILDTGIDIEHPDLKDNIWTNEAEFNGAEEEDDDANGFADDLHGWDFVNQTARIGDWNGHGTHCAGIAAAVGKNGIGITGANPDALIMPITVMQSDGTGDVATIIKGIDYAAANGADVISMSIGGYGYSQAEEQALAKAYNTAVLVAAAGNDSKCIYAHRCPVSGRIDNGPMFPAAFTFVLGVEASTKDGGLASFSNFDEDGPVLSAYSEEKLYNYELRAPGAQIMSTFPGGKYKVLNGTSMACPFVAGGISRLLQTKEYSSWEVLFGDLIHTRKQNGNGDVDFEAAYKITDADRKPSLGLVTYILDDADGGDGDSRPDAGETIAFYPTLRNEWGQAENIRFSLELTETEDPTIVEFLDTDVDFGKQLSSYGKNVSANPVRFRVTSECVDGRKICMVLRATCDNITEELVQEFTITVENGVEIGGMIMEDMTLYPNVHYIVTSNIAIPKGVTLTITPGTVLKFKDKTGIAMDEDASLHCVGTPDSMIVFTKADLDAGNISSIRGSGWFDYVMIKDIKFEAHNLSLKNSIIKGCNPTNYHSILLYNSVASETTCSNSYPQMYNSNFVDNMIYAPRISDASQTDNIFGNYTPGKAYLNLKSTASSPTVDNTPNRIYFGTGKESVARLTCWDMTNPNCGGFSALDFSDMITKPFTTTHAIVWKVVVNGHDAQDEFEQMPPLGVGKHKFEVYFNRPMDTSFIPSIAMGVRPPYKQITIAEDGSWNEDGTVYTAYLTITGKTHTDGLNRIYVADAVESFENYFISKKLKSLSQETESLLQELTTPPGKVLFQTSDKSKDGYVITSKSSMFYNHHVLFDGDVNTNSVIIYGRDGEQDFHLQVDLGIHRSSRFIRFNYHFSDHTPDPPGSIIVQGGNDGVVFNDVKTFSTSDITNPLPNTDEFVNSWNSFLIDALTPYRYYRFIFLPKEDATDACIAEFEMEVLDPTIKEDYISLLSFDEAIEIRKKIEDIEDIDYLCHIQNNSQSTLDRIYTDYNKLASILQLPLIEKEPIKVPSASAWVIPVENSRFNVEVAAAGSMATGLMAEAGLGKVALTWETDEEDFADLLGYNIYRYTMDEAGVSSDSIIVNPTVIDSEETSFVDYDVVPGTTYYYVIKQLTTSLTSHTLSNAVAATPLTAQKGDANGSLSVDIADVVTEVAYLTNQDPQPFIFEAADVNSDAEVNILDVVGTISIITTPAETGVSGMDNEPVRYYVQDGVLYMENTQPLGGVQVRLNVAKGTEITVLDGLDGMEQTCVWTSDSEYLFLAYSMSGRTLAAGTHALLQIGTEATVTEVVISDTRGKNITAVDGNATGIGKVEAVQLQMPSPNPFTTVLRVPYTIGKGGSHEVAISFSDLAGRTIDAYHTVNTPGEYTYTWHPKALAKGMYLVSLYLDGELMQTVKVIRE